MKAFCVILVWCLLLTGTFGFALALALGEETRTFTKSTPDVGDQSPENIKLAAYSCCHCYKRSSSGGPDFYMGVHERRSCMSYQGGYCGGDAPCP